MTITERDRIRHALLERLGVVGVAPDLKNDQAAVAAVCASMKADLAAVVDELTSMRLRQATQMMQRMGGAPCPRAC